MPPLLVSAAAAGPVAGSCLTISACDAAGQAR